MRGVYGVELKVTCKTQDVLNTLRTNREKHSEIVKEARAGYIAESKKILLAKLDELQAGKITTLNFGMSPPISHVKAYDTVIKMLELHQNEMIELSADEVKQFIQDEWEWTKTFIGSNSRYSNQANELFNSMASDD